MALVPLGNYVFFLAQLQTFGYVAVYFGALYWRYRCAVKTIQMHFQLLSMKLRILLHVMSCIANDRAGIVTQPMLDTPKKQFLLIGALEAAASILGFIGAAKLPGIL